MTEYILWCLTAVFLALDAVLALSLLEWWLLREPDEIEEVERSLREAVGMLAAAEPLTGEEEAEVGAFFAMLRKMPQ